MLRQNSIERERIPYGLSAIFLPELGGDDEEPLEAKKLLNRINGFLSSLYKAGIDIKGVIPVEVNIGKISGIEGDIIKERQLLIVKK